jgi:actin-related protein 5
VRKKGGADDSEEEEEVQSALKGVEKQLLEHDPSFTLDDTAERRSLRKHHLLNAFVRGMAPDDPLSSHDPENPEHTSRLHLNIERLRAVEPLFQPSMAGVDQAGMAELVEHVFKQFNAADRERLASVSIIRLLSFGPPSLWVDSFNRQRVFITGGNTLLPGFDHRIRTAIQSILPVGTTLNVEQSRDRVGAWRGMAQWARSPEFASTVVSKAEYDEYGGEYIKEHRFSNGYIHT